MRARGYEKWYWKNEAGENWRCSECGATVDEATHKHAGKGRRQAKPYNEHQLTCSPACANARKVRRQAERREEARQERARRKQQQRQHEQQRSRSRSHKAPPPPPPRSRGPTDESDAAIVGVQLAGLTFAALKRAWRDKIADHHPDRGGDTARAQEINAAYQRMRDRRGWR